MIRYSQPTHMWKGLADTIKTSGLMPVVDETIVEASVKRLTKQTFYDVVLYYEGNDPTASDSWFAFRIKPMREFLADMKTSKHKKGTMGAAIAEDLNA